MSTTFASLGFHHFLFLIVSSLTSRLFMFLCAWCNTHTRFNQTSERFVRTCKTVGLSRTICTGCHTTITYFTSATETTIFNALPA